MKKYTSEGASPLDKGTSSVGSSMGKSPMGKSWKDDESAYSLSSRDVDFNMKSIGIPSSYEIEKVNLYETAYNFMVRWLYYIRNKVGKENVGILRYIDTSSDGENIGNLSRSVITYFSVEGTDEEKMEFEEEYGEERIIPSREFFREIDRCKKYHFTVCLLKVVLVKGKKMSGHANALIFNNKNKIITRFEPNGMVDLGSELDLELNKLAIKLGKLGKSWKYKRQSDFCPRVGPQYKQAFEPEDSNTGTIYSNIGFCGAWSLMFIEYKLTNPKISDKAIIENILSTSKKSLTKKILAYVTTIVKNINKIVLNMSDHFIIGDPIITKYKYGETPIIGIIVKKYKKYALVLDEKNTEKRLPYEELLFIGSRDNLSDYLEKIKPKMKDYGIKLWY
jgi:hypothetical protein